jgi:hypothetical protein
MPKRAATWSYKIQESDHPSPRLFVTGVTGVAPHQESRTVQRVGNSIRLPARSAKGRLVVSQEEALTRDAFVERRLSFMVKF